MLPSETMIWQPEFTDKTLSRKPGAVHYLPREGNYRYSQSTFTRAQDWEKSVITAVEDAFSIIRRANSNLMRVRQLCRWNDTNLFKMTGDIDDFKMDNPL
ncbi:conjugative transfer protein MobI(A/C) [Escherichia coli]|uniref:conjugative transfer protein MobI(A/C) n=1 Tax=Escherichia coli TaxID=562 RepID=UPI003458FC19